MNNFVFLLGGPDVGKTTLFKQIAQDFIDSGLRVGLVDSDVGQSTIGPPTTIGMVVAEGALPDFSHAQAFYFVGNNNPIGRLMEVVVGSARMVDKAMRAGVDAVIFDSSGLVEPPYGTVLKYNKLELLRPRQVIAIEKKDELSAILSWLGCRDVEVSHIRPSENVRSRSAKERTKYRQEKYLGYFRDATLRELELGKLCLYPPNFLSGKTDLTGLLVGLQDAKWDTVAIGIIESIDAEFVSIFAPFPETETRGLVAGRIKLSGDCIESRVRS